MEVALAPLLAAASAGLAAAATLGGRRAEVAYPLTGPPRASNRWALRAGTLLPRPHPALRRRVVTLLAAAGSDLTVAEVLGRRRIAAAVGALVPLVLPPPGPMLVPVGATLGFAAPTWSLSRAARRRRSRADRELPLFLDLLAAATTSGLSGPLALRRAVEVTEGPLADELSVTIRRVDLGGRWSEELEGLAERLALPDLRRAVSVLTRSDRQGGSIAEALAQLAQESRDARRARVAERARAAPVKMLFPLVFLVLPAFLLLTVVPVLVTTLGSIR